MDDFSGVFFAFIFIGFFVLIGVGLLRVLFSPVWDKRHRTPEETLKDRYARGEISRDEYRQMLSEIRE